jgi:hypothetical protein
MLGVLLALTVACASKAPPSLSPADTRMWQANEAGVALGTIQRAAIDLNRIEACEPAPCRKLLSDTNTRAVIDVVVPALQTIRAVPDGWLATANAAVDQVTLRLDAAGKTKLRAYVEAARIILNQLAKGGL